MTRELLKKEFNIGDPILLFNSRLQLFPGKLRTRWIGPYEVTKVLNCGAVEIWNHSCSPFVVNGQRLKHYHRGSIPTYYSGHTLVDPPISTSTMWVLNHQANYVKQALCERQHTTILYLLLYYSCLIFHYSQEVNYLIYYFRNRTDLCDVYVSGFRSIPLHITFSTNHIFQDAELWRYACCVQRWYSEEMIYGPFWVTIVTNQISWPQLRRSLRSWSKCEIPLPPTSMGGIFWCN